MFQVCRSLKQNLFLLMFKMKYAPFTFTHFPSTDYSFSHFIFLYTGTFFSQGSGHYALGAPKANRLRGRVYLCADCFNAGSALRRRFGSSAVFLERNTLEVQGEQFGSRFGQAVAAVDVNGDGFSDLVVGAPLYTDEEANRVNKN